MPNTGQFPNTDGEAAFMLTLGPLARHAEDLMPVTRIVSGPDGEDPRCVERELGDPAAVDLRSVRVLLADGASLVPARRELRDARDRAAQALGDAGARVEHVAQAAAARARAVHGRARRRRGRHAQRAARSGRAARRTAHDPWADALRGRGDHTTAILITLAVERLHDRMPAGRTRRALAAVQALREEVAGILGDDAVLLHHPHPRVAPKHGATVGRAWVITPSAVFNLLGLPVTQVPLGLNRRGLPLGVQVAAAAGGDHLTIAAASGAGAAVRGLGEPAVSSGCCDPRGCDRFFNRRFARRMARAYRKRGLDATAQRMVGFLEQEGIAGATVLEIGGGVGEIHLELLRRGAERAVNLELSPAYDADAARLASEAGVQDRVERRLHDIAAEPEAIAPADVVVLHRVVCCYPDYERLLGAAAAHARRALVFSHPRHNLISGWWWAPRTSASA